MTTGLRPALRAFFECPPHARLSRFLTWLLCLVLVYISMVSIDPSAALPHNCTSSASQDCRGALLSALFLVYVVAVVGGALLSLTKIPPLLGMLLMGMLLRNIPHTNVAILTNNEWSSSLKKMSFAILLIKTGLEIDFQELKRFRFIIIRLGLLPCLIEGIVASIISHFLFSLPWFWSFTLGFVLGAVSPTVIVPAILELERLGLGSDQGPNSVIITAASADNIMSLSLFGIAFYLTFSQTSDMVLKGFQGPIEVLGGVSYGMLIGGILWIIPSADNDSFMFYRSVLMCLAAFSAIFGCVTFNVNSAGPMAVLTLAIVVAVKWKKENIWKNKENTLVTTVENLWWFLQPFLFGLFGADFDIKLVNHTILGFGLVVMVVSLACRMLTTFLVLFKTHFNMKERLFVCLSLIPKASIQAALAPLALEVVLKKKSYSDMKHGQLIVVVSFLSIIFTTTIGAALIYVTGPRLLQRRSGENTFESVIECQVPILESHTPYASYDQELNETINESM